MGGWNDMSCLERTAKILMVLTFIMLFIAFAMNVYFTIASAIDTWFVRCGRCTRQGGDIECGLRCCQACTKEDEVFYYVMRAYFVIFTVFGMLAEFKFVFIVKYMKACGFYLPRGLFQIFIGMLTVQTTLADQTSQIYADIIGYCIVILGVINASLGCCCFQEFDSEKRDEEFKDRYGEDAVEAGGGGAKPNAAAGGGAAGANNTAAGGGTYDNTYTYNGETHYYNSGGQQQQGSNRL